MRLAIGIKFLGLSLVFYSGLAWSLGLGDARVQSFIGQPLDLRIDLLTAPSDDLESVSARLASAEDFALIGADRATINVPLSFSVREGDAGSGAYVRVTSRLSISDPVLRLVVEVNWASGRLLREYTVFLDPPTVPASAPEPVTTRPAPAPAAVTQTAPPEVAPGADDARPPVAETAPTPEPAAQEPSVVAEVELSPEPPARDSDRDGDQYGPVQSGETLWRIASNYVGQSNLDMNQVMLAIQRRNPDAFMRDNINLLKRGAVLEMPSVDEVSEISRTTAQELVAQQEAAFRMRRSLASTSTPLLSAESTAGSSSESAAAADATTDDTVASRLEIVPASGDDLATGEPGTGSVPGGEGSDSVANDLREELARTEEDLISERQQNEYLRERIDELEAQLAEVGAESTQGTVTDAELANLEDRLQAERLESAEASADAADAQSSVPSVTTTAPSSEELAWYSGPVTWFIMIVILVAAASGWYMHRRRSADEFGGELAETETTVAGLKGEAEEILRALDTDREEVREEPLEGVTFVNDPDDFEGLRQDTAVPADADDEPDGAGESGDEEALRGDDEEQVVSMASRQKFGDGGGDAKFLDEKSSDPEIKLDLARAYISMGDKEAARVILEEVLDVGSDAQQAEARSMMEEL